MFPVILDAFNAVRPAPEPTKFVADRVLVPLFQIKFGVWITLVPPINNCPDVKVVKPVPPWATFMFPVILDAFNEVKPEPEPVILPDNFKLPEISTDTTLVAVPIPTFPPSNILKQVKPSSWISIIGWAPVWLTISAGPVPSFVINNCSVVPTLVFICVRVPFTIKLPSIRVSPVTCNFLFGCVVPIPTLLLLASIYNIPESIFILLDVSITIAPIPVPDCNINFPTDLNTKSPATAELLKSPEPFALPNDVRVPPQNKLDAESLFNEILPLTSNFVFGVVVPIPTLPVVLSNVISILGVALAL